MIRVLSFTIHNNAYKCTFAYIQINEETRTFNKGWVGLRGYNFYFNLIQSYINENVSSIVAFSCIDWQFDLSFFSNPSIESLEFPSGWCDVPGRQGGLHQGSCICQDHGDLIILSQNNRNFAQLTSSDFDKDIIFVFDWNIDLRKQGS